MVNLPPHQIIAIGAVIIFGPPIILGFLVGHYAGFFYGVVVGITTLLAVLMVARRQVAQALKREKESDDEDKEGTQTKNKI